MAKNLVVMCCKLSGNLLGSVAHAQKINNQPGIIIALV